MRGMRRLVVACLAVAGCAGAVADLDAGAPSPDSGSMTNDSGSPGDSGSPPGPDSGTVDSGASTDSGVRDSGIADAGGCRFAFCDDFESYDAGSPPGHPWTAGQNNGSVRVTAAKGHLSEKSVYVTTNDGGASYKQAYFSLTAPFFPKSEFYGRVWLYLTAVPTQTTHWTNIQGEGFLSDAGTDAGFVRATVRYGGQYSPRIMANYDSTELASDCWQHSMTGMPTGRWSCFEWHYKEDGNLMELWVDSTPLTDVTVMGMGQGCINHGLNDKWILPVFDTLRLGWEHYQVSDPIEMWMDDVALDTQRIHCQ
jgi:hypothetical protein